MVEKKQVFLIGFSLVVIAAILFSFSIPGVKAFFSKLNPFGASLIPLNEKQNNLKEDEIESQLIQLEERMDSFLEKMDVLDQRLAELTEAIGQGQYQEEQAKLVVKDQEEELEEELEEEGEEICSVNVNTALKEELEEIVGVGPVIAQRIIDSRPFSTVSDLVRVRGIGEKTLQKIVNQGCAFVTGVFGYFGNGGGGGGGGSNPPPVFPKILISEVQIAPTGKRFIELYNPINQDVTLTSWYVQRKTATGTSWNSLVTSTQFEGKIIPSKSHFLIARDEALNPDILLPSLTLTEDNVIRLRNPNQETADLVGWGQAQEFENAPAPNPLSYYSLGRKWDEETQNYQDTNDNSADFEIQKPTPGQKNYSSSSDNFNYSVSSFNSGFPAVEVGAATPSFAIDSAGKSD